MRPSLATKFRVLCALLLPLAISNECAARELCDVKEVWAIEGGVKVLLDTYNQGESVSVYTDDASAGGTLVRRVPFHWDIDLLQGEWASYRQGIHGQCVLKVEQRYSKLGLQVEVAEHSHGEARNASTFWGAWPPMETPAARRGADCSSRLARAIADGQPHNLAMKFWRASDVIQELKAMFERIGKLTDVEMVAGPRFAQHTRVSVQSIPSLDSYKYEGLWVNATSERYGPVQFHLALALAPSRHCELMAFHLDYSR